MTDIKGVQSFVSGCRRSRRLSRKAITSADCSGVAGIAAFLLPVRRTARTPPMKEPRNQVLEVKRFGGPDGLEVVDAPLPTAGRGEVRVRMLASGLEYTDVLIRRHLYPQTMRRRLPFVMGYDVVGDIDQLGDGVSGFQLGDRVADMTVVGSNAAYRTLRADRLTRVPSGVDPAEAATLILSWMTAYQREASACSCMERPAP